MGDHVAAIAAERALVVEVEVLEGLAGGEAGRSEAQLAAVGLPAATSRSGQVAMRRRSRMTSLSARGRLEPGGPHAASSEKTGTTVTNDGRTLPATAGHCSRVTHAIVSTALAELVMG